MNIAQLSLAGFEDGKKSIEDGQELSSLFLDAAEKIRQGIDDDAAAAGFDPHRPLQFDGAPDLTGHQLLAEMQALEARIDEEKNRHDQLIKATTEVWRQMFRASARKKFCKRLPEQAVGDIIQLSMHISKELKNTGLLKGESEPLRKQGTINVLMSLLHGYLASETVNGLRANIQARQLPDASQQTQTIPATQYEPALVKKIESLEAAVSEKDAEISSLRRQLASKEIENSALTERSRAQTEKSDEEVSKLQMDVTQAKLDLQDKQKEVEKLSRILRSTTEKYSEAKRQLTESEDTANSEVEDALPESTQAAREMSDDLMSLITEATEKKAEVERQLSRAEEQLKRKDALLESVQKTLEQRKSEIDMMRADIEQREQAAVASGLETARLKEEVESWKNDTNYYHSRKVELETSIALMKLACDHNGTAEDANEISRLQKEREETAQLLQDTQVSYDNAVEAWTMFCFGRDVPEELKKAVSNGTQIATQNHHPWIIEDTWTKTGLDNSGGLYSTSTFGEVFIKVVPIVLSGRLPSNDFIFLMRRLTLLTSQAASVNTAALEWLVEECHNRLSITDTYAEIPAKTAAWALSDVLTSRWPNMESHRQESLILTQAQVIIGSTADSPLRAYVMRLDDNQPDTTAYVVKKPDWPVGICIDTQKKTCSFIEPECTYGLYANALVTGTIVMEIRGPSRSIKVNFLRTHDQKFWSRDIW
ncbi:Laminin subunit alpha-2 [Colletotrichum sp. SAR 10_70]|nr:Laminin subunit alpha-2 [Colletotrichum sp. SAR 10_71]KAI8166784.1 Laminin subunit alpha-2 [Colletotrichum sp. SAR 10_65]KAI8187732.1 Laminin subunit alpha-2 [Colletotrichum sp. SAR 10_75]KAI8188053.1 Laminin subunit alpha-2 [Colletotrichum sp. SAR 10_70]KAI8208524.1 Laminin subunit alpha-2 [Colletotrichum sp. SAR 10_76]KAI8248064.1 Laminin subunit alpha-2 [Colletotrichum sp. SAR 10_77]KAJ4996834.1 Laminin subunit alpha-2 [Colletotrichum sp. SAR 10_66]